VKRDILEAKSLQRNKRYTLGKFISLQVLNKKTDLQVTANPFSYLYHPVF